MEYAIGFLVFIGLLNLFTIGEHLSDIAKELKELNRKQQSK